MYKRNRGREGNSKERKRRGEREGEGGRGRERERKRDREREREGRRGGERFTNLSQPCPERGEEVLKPSKEEHSNTEDARENEGYHHDDRARIHSSC